jgi:hypothetical protein
VYRIALAIRLLFNGRKIDGMWLTKENGISSSFRVRSATGDDCSRRPAAIGLMLGIN